MILVISFVCSQCFDHEDKILNTCVSKSTMWKILGTYSGSNEPPKVVISLKTSFKNELFKQFASKTSAKPLLNRFWVVLSPQMRPPGGCQGGPRTMVFVFLRLLNPSRSQLGSGTPFQRPPGSIFDRFLTDFGVRVD